MRRLTLIAALAGLALPFAAFADDHAIQKTIEKKIIVTEGDDADLAEIMEMVEAEIGDEHNLEVYVTKGEDGEVHIEKRPGKPHGPGHRKIMKMMDMHDDMDLDMDVIMEGPHGMWGRGHGRRGRMSVDAADCVLKNIKNAHSDEAAWAVMRACKTLNPKEDKSEEDG